MPLSLSFFAIKQEKVCVGGRVGMRGGLLLWDMPFDKGLIKFHSLFFPKPFLLVKSVLIIYVYKFVMLLMLQRLLLPYFRIKPKLDISSTKRPKSFSNLTTRKRRARDFSQRRLYNCSNWKGKS